jgi:hypothetical protein
MTPATTGTQRLVMATSDLRSFVLQRAPLLTEIARRRHKVVVIAPEGDKAATMALDRVGAEVVLAPFEARGLNPFGGYTIKRDLTGHLKAFRPHVVALCDPAAAIVMIAAKAANISRLVAMLPRLPFEVANAKGAGKELRMLLNGMSTVVVGTPEERRALVTADWFETAKPVFVAPTSGIDAKAHTVMPLAPLQDGFVFALVVSPGDEQAKTLFTDAAARLGDRAPQARFVMTESRNQTASTPSTILSAHAVVHASSQDGLSIGLLHALAAGRPIITTDVAASRDTVDERVNGCRVPPGDAVALADAMASFLKRTDLIPAMARASRLKAERRYDLTEVNRITLDALGLDAGFAAAA